MKGKHDWIIIQTDIQPAIQKCLRCGETDRMPFNKNVDYAVLLLKAFIKHHSKCKEKKINEV